MTRLSATVEGLREVKEYALLTDEYNAKLDQAIALLQELGRDAQDARAAALTAAWDAIDKYIKRGPLQGNGCDETAQRNGMILATNIISEMIHGPLPPPYKADAPPSSNNQGESL